MTYDGQMETITNNRTDHVIGPTDTERAIAAASGDPYDVVITCAPRYDASVWELEIRHSWWSVAEKLAMAGCERARYSTKRGGGRGNALLHESWDKIRTIWREEAAPIGLPHQVGADLVGVSRAQLYNILKGKADGKPTGSETEEISGPGTGPVPDHLMVEHERVQRELSGN